MGRNIVGGMLTQPNSYVWGDRAEASNTLKGANQRSATKIRISADATGAGEESLWVDMKGLFPANLGIRAKKGWAELRAGQRSHEPTSVRLRCSKAPSNPSPIQLCSFRS